MKKFLSICILIFLVVSLVAMFSFAASAEGEEVVEEVTDEVAQPTVAELVVNWATAHTTDIFTIMTFIGSLVLAYFYKKGLLPVLSTGLNKMSGTLGDGVSSIRTVTDAFATSTDERLKGFYDTIAPAMEKASQAAEIAVKVSETVGKLQTQLDESETDREAVKDIMLMQSKMFYEFFMAVNLPQYKKDELGATYTDMQKVISAIKPKEVE